MGFLKTTSFSAVLILGVASCSNPSAPDLPLQQFQTHLQSLCGQSYQGQVISTDPQDEDWRKETLTLGPVTCPDNLTTVLPLAVGSDRSRVWTLRLEEDGEALDFRHAHTLKMGRLIRSQDMAASRQRRTARLSKPSFQWMSIPKIISKKMVSRFP